MSLLLCLINDVPDLANCSISISDGTKTYNDIQKSKGTRKNECPWTFILTEQTIGKTNKHTSKQENKHFAHFFLLITTGLQTTGPLFRLLTK